MQEYMKNSSATQKTSTTPVWIIPLLMSILMLTVGFGAGVAFQKNKHRDAPQINSMNAGGFPPDQNRDMVRHMGNFGKVTSVSATSITINDIRANEDKTYTISSTTKVTDQGGPSAVANIKVGDTVAIQTSSSDTNTATQISLNLAPPTQAPENQAN